MEQPRKLKKADGRFVYQARVTLDGKRHSLGTYPTKKEATARQIQAHNEHAAGKLPIRRKAPSFEEFAEAHLWSRKDELARGTWPNYIRDYQNHLRPHFGHLKLSEVTPTKVKRWWADMADKPGPRRAAYGILSQVMKAAEEERLVDRWVAKRGGFRDVSTPRPTFTKGDVQMLRMLSTDEQVTCILWVLVASGLRIGEVLALDIEDVELDRANLRVNKHLLKDGTVARGRKKHENSDNDQSVTESAVEAIKALLTTREDKTGPLFLNGYGKRLSYSAWNTRWDSLRRACGLDHMHTHDIRAIHLTEFARHSTLADTMKRGNHSDYRSAVRYQRTDDERQREIVRQLQF